MEQAEFPLGDKHSNLTGALERRIQAPEKISYPGEHLGLTWRAIEEADIPAVMALYRESGSGLNAGEENNVVIFQKFLENTISDAVYADTLSGWNTAGEVKAFALVKVEEDALTELQAEIVGVVAESWRGKGIGRTILEWQDGRARQLLLAAGKDLPVAICTLVDSRNTERRRLLTAGGFSAKCRFTIFQRILSPADTYLGVAAAESLVAKGYELIPYRREYSEELRRIFNRITIARSKRQPLSEKNWQKYLDSFASGNSLLLLQAGLIVGYILCPPCTDSLCVKDFAVERGMRDKALETELLLALISKAAEQGIQKIRIAIESEMKMEESFLTPFGFMPSSASIVYSIDL